MVFKVASFPWGVSIVSYLCELCICLLLLVGPLTSAGICCTFIVCFCTATLTLGERFTHWRLCVYLAAVASAAIALAQYIVRTGHFRDKPSSLVHFDRLGTYCFGGSYFQSNKIGRIQLTRARVFTVCRFDGFSWRVQALRRRCYLASRKSEVGGSRQEINFQLWFLY
jgi:hypothetical protein